MKGSILALVAIARSAAAYPKIAEMYANQAEEGALEARQQTGGFPEPNPGFNAAQQLVSTSGVHKWVAPNFDAGDVRGPCPGLNALANHGYIPHSGVGSDTDFIQGTFAGLGMAADLSGFLTVLGSSIDGNGLVWSIGGPSKNAPGLPPLLGTPQGISGSHNRYEGDASPGRGDLYLNGDDYSLQMDQFQQLYDMGQAAGDKYSLQLLEDFRSQRFDHSVQNNAYFFNGPFTGVLVQPAAYSFIYRFMSNKSAEHPHGLLRGDTLMSFFGVTKNKKTGKLTHTPGYERIPDNWYKRAIGDEYSIPYLNLDTTAAASKNPKYLSIGGNQGKPNTFTGINPGDIMSGAGSTQDLLKGNNLACFAMEFAVQTSPDLIRCSGVLGNAEAQLSKLQAQFATSTAALQCPKLGAPNDNQFKSLPGYTKLNCKTGDYGPAA